MHFSSQRREIVLGELIEALRTNFVPDFIEKNRLTFADNLRRGILLKKGNQKERQRACVLASIVCISLGADGDDIYKELAPSLHKIISTIKEVNSLSAVSQNASNNSFPTCRQSLVSQFFALSRIQI